MEKVAVFLPSLFSVEKQLVERATINDDNPTPGYLLDEVASQTFVSAASCLRILEYLLVKLTDNSPDVRFKTLRVLKHLLKKGHELIAQELQKKAEQVRPCLGYTGPPHPFKGEAPYILVRNEAKEVMKLLFGSEEIRESIPLSPVKVSDIQPPSAKTLIMGTLLKHLSHGKGGASALVGSIVKLATPSPEHTNELSNFGGVNTSNKSSTSTDFSSTSPDGIWGPLNKGSEENRTNFVAESTLIDNFTLPGGARVAPSQSQISDFKKGVQQLDISIICLLLEAKLRNSTLQWQSKLKTLYAISALVEEPVVKKYFFEHLEALVSQLESVQRSVHDKAMEVIKKIHPDFKIEEERLEITPPPMVPSTVQRKSTQVVEISEKKQQNETLVSAIFQGNHKVEEKPVSKPKEGILVDITVEDTLAVVNPIHMQPKYEQLLSTKDSFAFVSQLLQAEKNK